MCKKSGSIEALAFVITSFSGTGIPFFIGSRETRCGLWKTVPVAEYDKPLAHILL
jgi:hypothetical protein